MPTPPKKITITVKTQTFSNLFSLTIQHNADNTVMTMKLFTQQINTKDIPATYQILINTLPQVLESKCFNDEDLPFSQEVKATEIGHLFEHILLEYLCQEKVSKGYDEATYNGVTNWNWKQDSYGTFYITVDAGFEDLAIFPNALQKTVTLIQTVLQTNAPHLVSTSSPTNFLQQYESL